MHADVNQMHGCGQQSMADRPARAERAPATSYPLARAAVIFFISCVTCCCFQLGFGPSAWVPRCVSHSGPTFCLLTLYMNKQNKPFCSGWGLSFYMLPTRLCYFVFNLRCLHLSTVYLIPLLSLLRKCRLEDMKLGTSWMGRRNGENPQEAHTGKTLTRSVS